MIKWVLWIACVLMGIISIQSNSTAQAQEPLTVYYENTDFFTYRKNGKMQGVYFQLGQDIFAKAGIEIQWQQASGNRILSDLSKPHLMGCAIGWRKTPEREPNYLFSKPIAQLGGDQLVILADRIDDFRHYTTFRQIMEEQKYKAAFRDNTQFTPYMSKFIETYRKNHIFIPDKEGLYTRLILSRRIDFLLLGRELIEPIKATAPPDTFSVLDLSDLKGRNRIHHIMCSKALEQPFIELLNRYIPDQPARF